MTTPLKKCCHKYRKWRSNYLWHQVTDSRIDCKQAKQESAILVWKFPKPKKKTSWKVKLLYWACKVMELGAWNLYTEKFSWQVEVERGEKWGQNCMAHPRWKDQSSFFITALKPLWNLGTGEGNHQNLQPVIQIA